MLKNICILRLSALGDVANCLPALRAIQKAHPKATITWIIGTTEYSLVKDILGVNFVVLDKNRFIKSWFLLRKLPMFDVILHMQVSLRASLFRTVLHAKKTIGFDNNRSKDFQKLFCDKQIKPHKNAHSLENYLDFAKEIGAEINVLRWSLPLDKMRMECKKNIILPKKYMVISPCSSKKIRNWTVEGYAIVADEISKKYHIPCILTGGNSEIEQKYAKKITELNPNILNLIGKTTVRQMAAIIADAIFIIAPDSGPVHIATATKTPVIGLYANTNPKRADPYLSKKWTVNQYPEAVQKYIGNRPVKFGTRVNNSAVMQLITVPMVLQKVVKLMQQFALENSKQPKELQIEN